MDKKIKAKYFFIAALLFFFILVPVLTVFSEALMPEGRFAPAHAIHVVLQAENLKTVFNSLLLGFLVVVTSSLLAVPLAFLLAKSRFARYRWLDILFLVPFMTPPYIASMGWILFVQRRGLFQQLFPFTGHLSEVFLSLAGLTLVMSFHSFPFMTTILKNAILNLGDNLDESARICGAGFRYRLRKITLPLLKEYKQINYVEAERGEIGDVFRKIFGTLKKIATHDKKVLFFLIAFFLYIDGVGTIIDNCINIGTDLGLPTVGQVVFLLATQVVAFGGSLVFARLSRKYRTAPLILVCIVGYFCVCIYALTLHSLIDFGILAFGVGCFQGSIQSLSRSYFSKIIPAENSGEYFGIYDIFAKGASFLGSAVIAAVKLAGGTINIAVASLAVFFALGFVFLRMSDKQPMGK